MGIDPFTAMMLATAVQQGISAMNSSGQSGPPQQQMPIIPDAWPLAEMGQFTGWQNETRSKMLADFYGGSAKNNLIGWDDKSGLARNGKSEAPQFGGEVNLDAPYVSTPYSPHEIPTILGGAGPYNEYINSDEFKAGEAKKDTAYWEDVNQALKDSNTPIPTRRWETSFTGTKPSQKYAKQQKAILSQSAAGFEGGLNDYMAQRGIDSGETVQGAGNELRKDYTQRSKEISAKAHDIYAQTLATLFGEVSDAGQQSAQLAGSIGQASQGFQSSMDQRYADAMRQWQYDQSQPQNPFMQSLGSLLPMLLLQYGGADGAGGAKGARTPSPYVDNIYSTGYKAPPMG